MLSMIPVVCPHCGVSGQIILPPLGAIIVGPCPHCREQVFVFCGKVLPLSTEIIEEGDVDQKAAHIQSVMMDHMTPKIKEVAEQLTLENLEGLHDYVSEEKEYEPQSLNEPPDLPTPLQPKLRGTGPITDDEFLFFIQRELPMVDHSSYFKREFEG